MTNDPHRYDDTDLHFNFSGTKSGLYIQDGKVKRDILSKDYHFTFRGSLLYFEVFYRDCEALRIGRGDCEIITYGTEEERQAAHSKLSEIIGEDFDFVESEVI